MTCDERRPPARALPAWGASAALCCAVLLAGIPGDGVAGTDESLAEIAASMEGGEWRELPGTQLRDVLPERASHPHWGNQGPQAVTRAWSGAAFDSKRNRLIVSGGGHGAYGGNEVYELDLESRQWERATEPSRHEPDPAFAEQRDPKQWLRTRDGTPVSRHTYDGMVYLPNVDRVLLWGGSLYSIGNSYDPHAWLYSPETRSWSKGAAAPRERIQVVTGYDPETGKALVEYGYGVYTYDPTTDTWGAVSTGNNLQHGHVGAFDPDRRLFIQAQIPRSAHPVSFYDLNNPGAARQHPEVTGDADFTGVPVPGIAHHPGTGHMVLWNGWKQTWVLDPETWQARRLENLAGPGPDHYGTDSYPVRGRYKTWGIYGRWAYVPDHDVFIGYGHVDDNAWLYRLPDDPFEWEAQGAATAGKACPADLCVGPDFPLKQPSQAARQAEPGANIAIQAGEYQDCAVWRHSVTIRGLDGRPRIGGEICRGKAVWVVQGDDTVIEGVELHGGYSPGGRNGEAIRHEGERLTVSDSVIHTSRMGILTNHNPATELELYRNEFYGMRSHSGLAHAVYAARIGRLVAEENYFHEGAAGHAIKSIAAENRIRFNYIRNIGGASAALVDLWGCTDAEVVGNVFVFSGTTGAIQALSIVHRRQSGQLLDCPREPAIHIAYNTAAFVDSLSRWSSFVRNHYGVEYTVANNLVVQTRDLEFTNAATGLGTLSGNVHVREPRWELFEDVDGEDFRPASDLPSSDASVAPPDRSYRHPASSAERSGGATPGAYESE